MRRSIALAASAAVTLAACGGGDSTQPQTEEGAVDATVRALRGSLNGDADAILAFATEECRESIDRDELELGMILLRAFIEDDSFDIGDIEISGEVEEFDGDTATIQLTYDLPEGAEENGLGGLMLSDDEIDVIYENGRWVGEDCDFGDTGGSSDADIESDLADLGLSGTREDPIAAGTVAPIGGGFEFVVDAWDDDALERYDEANETNLVLDPGDRLAVLEFSARYTDDEEPKAINDLRIDLVGSNAVALDNSNCGAIGPDLTFTSRTIFTGGAFSAVACFTGSADELSDVAVAVEGDFFQERQVFFDPTTTAASPATVTGSVGPSPDGDATDDRTNPAPLGTPIELDDWTAQVDGFTADVTDQLLADSTFADDPRPGGTFALLDVTVTYTGEGSSAAWAVSANLIGDSNVSADTCTFVSPPNELDTSTDVFTGGSLSGSLCYVLPADDADSVVAFFRSNAGFDDDVEFAAVR